MTKVQNFINTYLDSNGNSNFIKRYELPKPFAYTSGDGIFRLDSTLGRKYKFITVKLNKKIRYSWKPNDEEQKIIEREIKNIDFTDKNKKIRKYSVFCFKFYGKKDIKILPNRNIKKNIIDIISKLPCAHCGLKPSNEPTQVDHKNDLFLKNDPRLWNVNTQQLDDFQPLCRRCNCLKRSYKKKMLQQNRRISAKEFGYNIDFIKGDETLNIDDPYWYVGSYWGDVLKFKKSLYLEK